MIKEIKQTIEGTSRINDYDAKIQALNMRKAEAELQDLEERLAEREMKRETKRQRSKTNGMTLQQIENNNKANQALLLQQWSARGRDNLRRCASRRGPV